LERGGSSAVVRGWARPRPTALLPLRSEGKPEAATAVVELPIMGMKMAETCWAVFKSQVINWKNCCIWLVDSFEDIKTSMSCFLLKDPLVFVLFVKETFLSRCIQGNRIEKEIYE
jgi:hypothetical protein